MHDKGSCDEGKYVFYNGKETKDHSFENDFLLKCLEAAVKKVELELVLQNCYCKCVCPNQT